MSDKELVLRLRADNAQLIKKLSESKREIKNLSISADSYSKNITKSFSDTSKGSNSLRAGIFRLGQSFRAQKGALSQFGYQIQDVAVQLQGGQNAALVFAQQGSQMASVFGPGGAVVGAVLAVSAALGSALIPRLLESKDSVELLEDSLKASGERFSLTADGVLSVTDRIRELSKISTEAAKVDLSIGIAKSEIAIRESANKIKDILSEIGEYRSIDTSTQKGRREATSSRYSNKKNASELGVSVQQFKELSQAAQKFNSDPTIENIDAFYRLGESLDFSNEKLEKIYSTFGDNAKTIRNQTDAIQGMKKAMENFDDFMVGQLGKQGKQTKPSLFISELDYSDDSFNKLQIALMSENELLENSYQEKLRIIENEERDIFSITVDTNNARLRAEKQFNDEKARMQANTLAGTSQFLSESASILQQGYGEQNAISKAAFAASKLIAIPNMMLNVEQAATEALKLGVPLGPIASSAIKALGYASIGTVAGLSIASFEGGGRTPNGPRTGGLDGRGGMLSVLHPNEKVVDLNKQKEGISINIVNNVSNARPRAEMDRNGVVNILIDELGRQNSRPRAALHRTSNSLPRATR